MIFRKYNHFIESNIVNENIQMAKKFLADRIKTKDGEKPTPEQIKAAESDPDFNRIKQMLSKHPGYVYAFTKFHFQDGVSLKDLEEVYNKLKKYRQVSGIKAIDDYANHIPTADDQRPGFEILGDDIAKVELGRITKEFVDQLSGNIRDEYRRASDVIKDKVDGIAKAFDELGTDDDGKKDLEKNATLQKNFFSKISRYKTLSDVINNANNFLMASTNEGLEKLIKAIDRINKRFGDINGVDIMYNDHDFLIVEVKSYQANNALNSNTSHCIASNRGHWDSYVGGDSLYNKQYYIYNFNIPNSDNNSIIGITIEHGGTIRACHNKPDHDLKSNIKSILKKWESEYNIDDNLFRYFKPMTDDEKELKRRRVIANRELVKKGLTAKQITEYVNDGGDPNAQSGKPLINAIEDNNLEVVKTLFELGAIANIGEPKTFPIRNASSIEMLKLLVENGAEITAETISKEENVTNYETLKYLLDNGGDPNSDNALPIRVLIKGFKNDKDEKYYAKDCLVLLLERGADPTIRNTICGRMVLESGQEDMIKLIFDKLNESDSITEDFIKNCFNWLSTAEKGKVDPDKIIRYTYELIKGYGNESLANTILKEYIEK